MKSDDHPRGFRRVTAAFYSASETIGLHRLHYFHQYIDFAVEYQHKMCVFLKPQSGLFDPEMESANREPFQKEE